MDDFIKKIFVACDKDQDGYLDRADLQEVKNQFGLEGNISEILQQFGAADTGKISFSQFCKNSAILIGDLSGSESSPEYYSTDSDTQLPHMDKLQNTSEQQKLKFKQNSQLNNRTNDASATVASYGQESDLDLELEVSGEKIKQISEAWVLESHRKSGSGGIEDYLDPKTLQHLEELNIIDPHTTDRTLEPEPPPMQTKEILSGIADLTSGREKSGPDYMEISRQLHLAALSSYKNEIFELNTRLQQIRKERDGYRKKEQSWKAEKQKMQHDFEEKLQSQTMRITELQSVIAELTRKLNKVNGNTIIEEEEEPEEDDCGSGSISDLEVQGSRDGSECSCDNCDSCEHHMNEEGPNQVNFLATTHEMSGSNLNISGGGGGSCSLDNNNEPISVENSLADSSLADNLKQQLSSVLERIEDRTKFRDINDTSLAHDQLQDNDTIALDVPDGPQPAPKPGGGPVGGGGGGPSLKEQMTELSCQVEILKRDKRTLEKQLHNISVQGYVYQKGNTAHVEEEFTKLRQENQYLRSKLLKAEQEIEAVKVAHITIKDEKDRLKKQKRALQETLDGKHSPVDRSSTSSGSVRNRSQSLIGDRPISPSVINRLNSGDPARHGLQTRSTSVDQRPQLIEASEHTPGEVRKYSAPSSGSPHSTLNSKGYRASPDNTMMRQHNPQHMPELSDLGSSIGDDSHRADLSRTLIRNLHGRIPDTLLQTLMTYQSLEQVLNTLIHHFVTDSDEKVREGLINIERLESRMAHLQSQNDLLQLSLDESKQNAERLSLLCGKYESNSTAWSLALQNTEQLIETYEVMLQLQDSEADLYVSNCNIGVVGTANYDTIKSLTSTKSSHSNISYTSEQQPNTAMASGEDDEILKSFQKRKDAETQARMLLLRLDKKYENMEVEELKNDCESSYKSRTSTGSSQNSACTDTLSKDEEHRLRDYIKRLKTESGIYKGTVIELELFHEYSDHHVDENLSAEHTAERTHELNVDIEAAVTLQEMQALKEERAELKHRIYLLEKEKRALELKMSSYEAQEQAHLVHIEHLKSEVKEQIQSRKKLLKEGRKLLPGAFAAACHDDESMSTSDSGHSGPTGGSSAEPSYQSSNDEVPQDLIEATRRERKLKTRIHELVDTLEKLSKNSEIRHKQTAEYISDLKRANGALVTAYEKAKKRHASRLKKFEQQLVQMAAKYQVQVRALKEQIANLKESPPPPTTVAPTETSL